jgi:hypothetical protein
MLDGRCRLWDGFRFGHTVQVRQLRRNCHRRFWSLVRNGSDLDGFLDGVKVRQVWNWLRVPGQVFLLLIGLSR